MTIVALAEQHPELFGDRVVGVGADLDHRRRARPAPGADPAGARGARAARWAAGRRRAGPRALGGRRRAPAEPAVRDGRHRPVRLRRRRARGVRRVRRRDAVGDAVRGGRGVLPALGALDKFDAVAALARVPPDHLRHRGQAHLDRPQPQAALADLRVAAARVRRRRPHGDPRAARAGQRRARPAARRGGRSGSTAVSAVEVRPVGPEAAAAVLAVIRRRVRGAPAAGPAGRPAGRDRRRRRRAARRTAGCWPPSTASRSARWCSTRSARTMYLRRFGVLPDAQGHGVAARLIEAAVEQADGLRRPDRGRPEELPRTVAFWERQGFREIRREAPNVELRRPLHTFLFEVPDADDDARSSVGRSPASSAPATWSCSPASSAPARPRSPRASAPGSACAATSPRRRS